MNQDEFKMALALKGIYLSETQLEQFKRYFELLIEWNNKINLTAITEESEVYLKHFYDSLMPLWMTPITDNQSLCDVGAGAGFPSLPMKIIRPDLQVTIIDSLNKRINFLKLLVDELGLDHVNLVHARAEEAGQDPLYRGQFDIVTARAVASLNVLSELCLPLNKKGGYFLALKSQASEDELKAAQKAIQVLGAKYEGMKQEELPVEGSERTILVIRKTLETPNKYPRRPGKPNKQPIK
ncbi:16S rRNA (guanine(527)-N(7))-methyltransferase RsmG [Hutsoniella sourekii]|uniref:16S rRNA (guanine(527)-N(7))-methyltransferase RsmG n=1 Tax=Hutsoniella sourekii TaxID=87650 RepID=UPI0004850E9E|nr:16S rRNA (guanine(527)-N(7))-methyltransferase RsmG [Hutsoniella sourekii]